MTDNQFEKGSGMALQPDRISKLDDLFDQACEKLLESPVEGDVGEITPVVIDLVTVMLAHYTGIIDRWLQVREADRQYELTANPIRADRLTKVEAQLAILRNSQ